MGLKCIWKALGSTRTFGLGQVIAKKHRQMDGFLVVPLEHAIQQGTPFAVAWCSMATLTNHPTAAQRMTHTDANGDLKEELKKHAWMHHSADQCGNNGQYYWGNGSGWFPVGQSVIMSATTLLSRPWPTHCPSLVHRLSWLGLSGRNGAIVIPWKGSTPPSHRNKPPTKGT